MAVGYTGGYNFVQIFSPPGWEILSFLIATSISVKSDFEGSVPASDDVCSDVTEALRTE